MLVQQRQAISVQEVQAMNLQLKNLMQSVPCSMPVILQQVGGVGEAAVMNNACAALASELTLALRSNSFSSIVVLCR